MALGFFFSCCPTCVDRHGQVTLGESPEVVGGDSGRI